MKDDWNKWREMALDEVETTIAELPIPLREQAQKLSLTLEDGPNSDLQADGVESDTLGLFVGAEFADETNSVLPSQVVLFLKNLWEFAGADEVVFRAEVRKTFMHELGHFFGLDEDDLTDRGLE